MRNCRTLALQLAVLVLLTCIFATPSNADTGSVRIGFTKAGFVVGLGTGRGILTPRASLSV
jgi:hypothetical protein